MKNFPPHRTKLFVVLTIAILLALLMVGPSAIAGDNDDLIDDSFAANPLAVDTWLQQAKLSASDGMAEDTFGHSVAISGDIVVVGVPGDDGGKGSVYVFEKPDGGWMSDTETARLSASDGLAEDSFGRSVAISDGTVVVGAPGADNDQGSAYVFVKQEGGWANATETAKLSASDRTIRDRFGSVAISGGTVVVGAPGMLGAPGEPASRPGSVYVFVQPGGGWTDTTQTAKLTPTDGYVRDWFGSSVAISDDTVVAGMPGYLSLGSAYVFVQPAGGWTDATQTAKLTASDGADYGYLSLGVSVAISGDTVVAGAYGPAYVFEKPGGGWVSATETAKLSASDGTAGDRFGKPVVINENTVVVGASGVDNDKGLAYVFEKLGGGWASATETAKLSASDGATNDYFGGSVAISGDTVVVGASGDDSSRGSAYVFENHQVWRFRGYTYQGQPPATFSRAFSAASTPIGGVTLTLYGRSQNEPAPGAWHKITQSGADGFYNFFIVQPWVFDIFRLEVEPPDGMVVSGISTDTGQVVGDNAIEWYGPPPQVHFSDFYFDEPTPTPTATSAPTATPTLPPTVTPTATPVSYDIWLPLLRR